MRAEGASISDSPRPERARSVLFLLLKDLQILRRSPLQALLLVAYPVLIALLVGFAISRAWFSTFVSSLATSLFVSAWLAAICFAFALAFFFALLIPSLA